MDRQPSPTRPPPRGFTLMEVLIALVVMLLGASGALLALLTASHDLREGQLRLYKTVLVDASLERARLQDKAGLVASAVSAATLPSDATAISASPWGLDPTTRVDGDLSTGAYFSVLPNGTIAQLSASSTPAVPASTACSAVPVGVYCREVVTTRGAPVASPGAIATGASVATIWVRVSRRGEPSSLAAVGREVIVQ